MNLIYKYGARTVVRKTRMLLIESLSRRGNIKPKLPGALRAHRPHIKWSVDYSYLSKLNQIELDWLAGFTEGYYHGTPAKDPNSLTPRKESYYRSNSAQRDMMNQGSSIEFYEWLESQSNEDSYEDILIEWIDSKHKENKDNE